MTCRCEYHSQSKERTLAGYCRRALVEVLRATAVKADNAEMKSKLRKRETQELIDSARAAVAARKRVPGQRQTVK